MRKVALFAAASSIAALGLPALVTASCTHGSYDGSGYDGAVSPPIVDANTSGHVVATKTIDPAQDQFVKTPDGALEVTFAPATFDGPTEVTIRRLDDRTIENNLVVPVYSIAAPKEPLQPYQVAFQGNNPNGGNPNAGVTLLAAEASPAGDFKPLGLVGANVGGTGGGTNVFWGLARKLGTFSLVYQSFSQSNTFLDVVADSCLTHCCGSMTSPSANAGAIGGSCACSAGPNLACFLRYCPNVAAAIDRCVEIANNGAQTVSCTNSASVPQCQGGPPQCGYPTTCGSGTCCINNHAGQCVGQGNPGGTSCPGIAIRCDLATSCPTGTKCCVFDNEAYCASTCPNERTWCRAQSDCDGGAALGDAGPDTDGGPCFVARSCPHGTCGTPPTACTN